MTASLPWLVWSSAPSLAFAPLMASALAMLVFGERIVTLGWDRRLLRDKLFHWGGVPAFFLAVFAEEDARQAGAICWPARSGCWPASPPASSAPCGASANWPAWRRCEGFRPGG